MWPRLSWSDSFSSTSSSTSSWSDQFEGRRSWVESHPLYNHLTGPHSAAAGQHCAVDLSWSPAGGQLFSRSLILAELTTPASTCNTNYLSELTSSSHPSVDSRSSEKQISVKQNQNQIVHHPLPSPDHHHLQILSDPSVSLLLHSPPLLIIFLSILNNPSCFSWDLFINNTRHLQHLYPLDPSWGSTELTARRGHPSPPSSWRDWRTSTSARPTSPSLSEQTSPRIWSWLTPRSRSGSRTDAPRRRESLRLRSSAVKWRDPICHPCPHLSSATLSNVCHIISLLLLIRTCEIYLSEKTKQIWLKSIFQSEGGAGDNLLTDSGGVSRFSNPISDVLIQRLSSDLRPHKTRRSFFFRQILRWRLKLSFSFMKIFAVSIIYSVYFHSYFTCCLRIGEIEHNLFLWLSVLFGSSETVQWRCSSRWSRLLFILSAYNVKFSIKCL